MNKRTWPNFCFGTLLILEELTGSHFENPDSQAELKEALLALEEQIQRFETNCNAINEYQESILTIAKVWSLWFVSNNKKSV